MRKVMQDKLYTADGIANGNCLAACFASLLDMPLWMVPPFDQMFGRGHVTDRIVEWLAYLGYDYIWTDGHQVELLPEFYIVSGRSKRDVLHAVIYSKGVLVHDPHFSGLGVEDVQSTYHLEPIKELTTLLR